MTQSCMSPLPLFASLRLPLCLADILVCCAQTPGPGPAAHDQLLYQRAVHWRGALLRQMLVFFLFFLRMFVGFGDFP